MPPKPDFVAEDRARRCLGAMRKYRRPLGLKELCFIVGMTNREGDLAVKRLKRQGLAKFGNYNGLRGWAPTKKGVA